LKLLKNKLVFTEEDGTWSAHDPTVEGVYGLGPTRKAAKEDLRETLELLDDYVDDVKPLVDVVVDPQSREGRLARDSGIARRLRRREV